MQPRAHITAEPGPPVASWGLWPLMSTVSDQPLGAFRKMYSAGPGWTDQGKAPSSDRQRGLHVRLAWRALKTQTLGPDPPTSTSISLGKFCACVKTPRDSRMQSRLRTTNNAPPWQTPPLTLSKVFVGGACPISAFVRLPSRTLVGCTDCTTGDSPGPLHPSSPTTIALGKPMSSPCPLCLSRSGRVWPCCRVWATTEPHLTCRVGKLPHLPAKTQACYHESHPHQPHQLSTSGWAPLKASP